MHLGAPTEGIIAGRGQPPNRSARWFAYIAAGTAMDFNADHFALFQLPRKFRLDLALLDRRFKEIQLQIHPDKFAHAGDSEKRLSLQWATRVNEAYQTLKQPIARARYVLELFGVDVNTESNTAMPSEFLMDQMEWREAVAEARVARDFGELEQLHHRVKQRMNMRIDQMAVAIDDRHDFPDALDRLRRLMFLERLLIDIDESLAQLEA